MGLIDEVEGVEEINNETISKFNEVCKKCEIIILQILT